MVILGAGGMASELLQAMASEGDYRVHYLFDNINSSAPDLIYNTYPVIRTWQALCDHFVRNSPEFIIGVGGASNRHRLASEAIRLGGTLASYISTNCKFAKFNTNTEPGVCILPDTLVSCDVNIGAGTLINHGARLFHHATVGRYCDISPGATVLGRANVGDFSEIGANAVILPDIHIGTHCRIGAGAIVTKDVPDNTTAIGVPARPRT